MLVFLWCEFVCASLVSEVQWKSTQPNDGRVQQKKNEEEQKIRTGGSEHTLTTA